MRPVDTFINDLIEVRDIPGLSLRLSKNGREIFSYDSGFANIVSEELLTNQHHFRVGCLTKPIVAHAILHLAHRYHVKLDDSIGNYIPELYGLSGMSDITISHLLCHTSGLARGPYYSAIKSDESALSLIKRSTLLFKPGAYFKYSNWGYYLLGVLIEYISGDSADKYILKYLFTSLSMHSSSFSSPDNVPDTLASGYWKNWYFGQPDPAVPLESCPYHPLANSAAGLITTADDYLKWLIAFTGDESNPEGLGEGLTEEMLISRHRLNSCYASCFGFFVVLIDDMKVYFFAGNNSGYSGYIFAIPQLSISGIALSNHDSANNILREILYQVACELCGRDRIPSFGYDNKQYNLIAENAKGHTIQLNGNTATGFDAVYNNQHIPLYPHSDSTFTLLHANTRHHVLRVHNHVRSGTVLTLGDEAFHTDTADFYSPGVLNASWPGLSGLYHNSSFGFVEIISRGMSLHLSFGVLYETILKHVTGLRFKQQSGPFRYEEIEFKRDESDPDAVTFLLNNMIFIRQIKADSLHHDDQSDGQTKERSQ